LIEICGCYIDDEDSGDSYDIVITLSEDKNKALNTNQNFHLHDVSIDLSSITTKEKQISESFPSQIISNVNCSLFNDIITEKKECLSKTVN
jgi:hypothetical protein